MSKIKVEMVCECGYTVREESHNRCTEGVYVLYDTMTYICGECGRKMSRRVTKIEITERATTI